jgi:hypothetical protein
MEEGNFAVIVDAKTEYTKQLINVLRGGMYQCIKKIFTECREKCEERGDLSSVLTEFQSKLEEVPKWNQVVILGECDTLLTESNCDWIEDLITAVFVSHTRVLTSINFSKNKKQINLKVPKTDHFIHQCYIDIARIFYKVPYLMDDTTGRYEFQRNRNEAEGLIEKSIETTIRKQLPVKHILQEYLGNDYIAKETEVEERQEEIPVVQEENKLETATEEDSSPKLSDLSMDIKELVKNEIENSVKALETPEEIPKDYTNGTPIEMTIDEPELSLETEEPTSNTASVATATDFTESEEPAVASFAADATEEETDATAFASEEELEDNSLGDLDLDLDLDLSTEVDLGLSTEQEETDIKNLSLSETHSVLPDSESTGLELGNEEVKTILLDTKNSLTDEDIEKKNNLRSKKTLSFFNDSLEEDTE